MKGVHRIIVQNKRVKYDFELRRNLTVIRGDSATGKTTLIEMIRESKAHPLPDQIRIRGVDRNCGRVSRRNQKLRRGCMIPQSRL